MPNTTNPVYKQAHHVENKASSKTPLDKYLPLDYVSYGKQIFIHAIAGPSKMPSDAFISQTERSQLKNGARRTLIPLKARQFHHTKNKHLSSDNPNGLNEKHYQAELPAGFIFHSSRCGSTLLCNMLDTLPNCYVIRESGIINKILNDPDLSEDHKTLLFSSVIESYVAYSKSLGKRCIIKFTSYCVLHIQTILNAHQGTPWIYLHRDPKTVLLSIGKNPPPWVSPLFIKNVLCLSDEETPSQHTQQAALIIGQCLRKVIQHHSHESKSKLFSYQQLLDQNGTSTIDIACHFNFDIPAESASIMSSCLHLDAKTGQKRSKDFKNNEKMVGSPSEDIHNKTNTEIELAYQDYCRKDYEYLCAES